MSASARQVITVFGGSGFVGRYVVRLLAQAGHQVRVAVRDRDGARFLKPMGEVGQIVPLYAPVQDAQAIREVVAGADRVVNLVAVLSDGGKQSFEALHARAPELIAQACKAEGVKALVHISALGADLNSPAAYARSKAEGEHRLLRAYPKATILRPSVIFGEEDQFMNRFASLAQIFPFVPLMGRGQAKLQPVFVEEVAQAVFNALFDDAAQGQIYEVVGPKVYSWREIMEFVRTTLGLSRPIVSLPLGFLGAQALVFERLPRRFRMLTRDQLKLVQLDNIATQTFPTQADLGVGATEMEGIVRGYLARS